MNSKLQRVETERIEPTDRIEIGEWYWVSIDDEEWNEDKEESEIVGRHEELLCVAHVGSNFVEFTVNVGDGSSIYRSGIRVHLDEFHRDCRLEPDWRDVFQNKVMLTQERINEKMSQLRDRVEALHLDNGKGQPSTEEIESTFALSTTVKDPREYKNQLVVARDEYFPLVTKEIEKMMRDLAVQTRNRFLPDQLRMDKVKERIETIEDKIFTVELYVGIEEQIRQIKTGLPASTKTPITIRQMLLYMDEEALFDYKSGGMDFRSLRQFDKWIVKRKNLGRILPEERGIVALRVRRYDKDYGTPSSLLHAWVHMLWNIENKRTYLLIRNGENVYRIATELDFTPRLIPLKNEIFSDKGFIKRTEHYNWEKRDHEVEEELITPVHMDYDEFLLKEMRKIKQYNRIMLILQGLIDRTTIFHPMPRVDLGKSEVVNRWTNIIRDEETLPAPPINWDEYRDQLNKTLKKGKIICVGRKEEKGEYGYKDWVSTRPTLYKVISIRRDRSAIEITWPHKYLWSGYDRWGKWKSWDEKSGRMKHAWIPIKYLLNVSDYTIGDYKMFLCNRAALGAYLEWAPYLLTAEDYARGTVKLEEEGEES